MAQFKLTTELENELVDAVSKGVPVETAARAVGIGPSTLYGWLRIAKSGVWDSGDEVSESTKASLARFAERIAGAEAAFEALQVRRLAEAAEAVNEKTGLTDWRARAWLLNNHPRTRERYRQHKEVIVDSNSTVTHEHRMVSGLQISELETLEQQLALPTSDDN